jgi:predicted ATPase/transcriptional regulator with XRE-family HTH domain
MATEEITFNLWIRQRRRALDLTQDELAECVGCSRIAVQKIELGERRPSKQVAQRLAECLQLSREEQEAFVRYARGEAGSGDPYPGGFLLPVPAASPSVSSKLKRPNPNNLSAPLTRLLGRGQELAEASAYLFGKDVRLLTFTGAPGIGKTRLALEVAAHLLPRFGDGTFFVELAPISDPLLVASTIASTLGVAEIHGELLLQSLKHFLIDKRMLLVLDNFEQVLDAAPNVIELLRYCPGLKVLVTSREALHMPGEQQFPVSTLDLPDLAHMPGAEDLSGYSAIALFLERAAAVHPNFQLTAENAPEVATICIRLEGLPLAIELAAAHSKFLSPPEILALLDNQLRLLAGTTRDRHFHHLPARQQTMRAAIDWSYRLLEGKEQRLFSRLGVFVGGWTLEAAAVICAATAGRLASGASTGELSGAGNGQLHAQTPPDLLFDMESLLEKSLIGRDERGRGPFWGGPPRAATYDGRGGESGEKRFVMLEPIREYAVERLRESGEAEDLRRQHVLYFLSLAEEAKPHLAGSQQVTWLNRLEEENDNLRAALAWLLHRDRGDSGDSGDIEIMLRLAAALGPFWRRHDHVHEGLQWSIEVLDKVQAPENTSLTIVGKKALVDLLYVVARHIWDVDTDNIASSRRYLEKSLELAREISYAGGTSNALDILSALTNHIDGDPTSARKLSEEALELAREAGDKQAITNSTYRLAQLLYFEGDYAAARSLYLESAAVDRELGDKYGSTITLVELAAVLVRQGYYAEGHATLEEATALARESGSRFPVIFALTALAQMVLWQGDFKLAHEQLDEALALSHEIKDGYCTAITLVQMGELAREEHDYARALSLFDETLALCRELHEWENTAYALFKLGCLMLQWGRPAEALRYFTESLDIYGPRKEKFGIAMCLTGFASLASAKGIDGRIAGGRLEHVVKLLAAAEALLESMGARLFPPEQAERDQVLAICKEQLSKQALSMGWARGHGMTAEQAIAYALHHANDD